MKRLNYKCMDQLKTSLTVHTVHTTERQLEDIGMKKNLDQGVAIGHRALPS